MKQVYQVVAGKPVWIGRNASRRAARHLAKMGRKAFRKSQHSTGEQYEKA